MPIAHAHHPIMMYPSDLATLRKYTYDRGGFPQSDFTAAAQDIRPSPVPYLMLLSVSF